MQLIRSISSSNAVIASEFIQFPITLEQQLMEGAYNQVLHSRSAAPSPRFQFFLSLLEGEVREKIGKCAQAAFDQYPSQGISKLLLLNSPSESSEWIAKSGWKVGSDGSIDWRANESAGAEATKTAFVGQNYQTIAQTLKFATELESIV